MSSDPHRPGLRDFQTWMQTFIVSSGTPQDALFAAEHASGFDQGSAERLVKPSPTLNEMERLLIYRRMYPLRMEEALSIDFPVCAKLLGRKTFFQLVMDYVEKHPSTSWTLDHLGRHVVPFVESHALARKYPGLLDLARLEQALCEVFNELDAEVLRPADLARVDPQAWPDVRLETIPAFRLLRLESNANALYKAHNNDHDLPEHTAETNFLVVWRQDFQTWRMPLSESAYAMLEALCQGQSLGEALSHTLDRYPTTAETQVFEWFNTWVSEGFFATLHLPEPLPVADSLHPN